MRTYSKDQLRQALEMRPSGISQKDVVQRILDNGDQIEGFEHMTKPVAAEQAQQPERSFLDETIGNIPSSAANMLGGMGSAILNPIDTAKSLGQAAIGGVVNAAESAQGLADKAVYGIGNAVFGSDKELPDRESGVQLQSEETASAIGDFYVNRYGSVEQAAETLKSDPVGFLSDVSMFVTAGGGAISGLGKLSGSAKVASAGQKIAKAGQIVEPVSGAAKMAGAAAGKAGGLAGKVLKSTAEGMYQSALKPAKAVLDKFPDVVRTGLDEGIVVSKGSLDDLTSLMDDIDDGIAANIEAAGKGGLNIATDDVLSRLDDVKKFFGDSVGGSKMIEAVDEIGDLFKKEQGKAIPAAKAQAIKKNTQNILRKAYGELKSEQFEAKKAIARGLKEELAKQIPEIAELNSRQSKLIGLNRAMERAVGRSGNRDIFGLAGGVGVGVGASNGIGGALKGGIIAKTVKALADNPTVKSQVALILDKLADGKNISPEVIEKIRRASMTLRAASIPSQTQDDTELR